MASLFQQPNSAFCFFLVAGLATMVRTLQQSFRCHLKGSCLLQLLLYFTMFIAVAFGYMYFLTWVHLQGHTLIAWILSGLGMWLSLGTLR